MCAHMPSCPDADDTCCWTAHVVSDHSEQGWCRLCNGVILFDDGYFLAPDGHTEPVLRAPRPDRARRPLARATASRADDRCAVALLALAPRRAGRVRPPGRGLRPLRAADDLPQHGACPGTTSPDPLDQQAASPAAPRRASLRACSSGGTSEHKDGRAIDWTMDATSPRRPRAPSTSSSRGSSPPTPTATSTRWPAGWGSCTSSGTTTSTSVLPPVRAARLPQLAAAEPSARARRRCATATTCTSR